MFHPSFSEQSLQQPFAWEEQPLSKHKSITNQCLCELHCWQPYLQDNVTNCNCFWLSTAAINLNVAHAHIMWDRYWTAGVSRNVSKCSHAISSHWYWLIPILTDTDCEWNLTKWRLMGHIHTDQTAYSKQFTVYCIILSMIGAHTMLMMLPNFTNVTMSI